MTTPKIDHQHPIDMGSVEFGFGRLVKNSNKSEISFDC